MKSEDAHSTLREVARPGGGVDDKSYMVSLRRLPLPLHLTQNECNHAAAWSQG